MDHAKATEGGVAERYILGELSQAERDEFEEHLFACGDCAGDVRDLLIVTVNAKAVLAESESRARQAGVSPPKRNFWGELLRVWALRPAVAMASLAGVAILTATGGYQLAEMRNRLVPQAVASYVLHSETRGVGTTVAAEEPGAFLLLELDVPHGKGEWKWQIRRDGSDTVIMEGTAGSPPAGATLKLLLPASRLKPGVHTLTVFSGTSTSLSSQPAVYRFRMM